MPTQKDVINGQFVASDYSDESALEVCLHDDANRRSLSLFTFFVCHKQTGNEI